MTSSHDQLFERSALKCCDGPTTIRQQMAGVVVRTKMDGGSDYWLPGLDSNQRPFD